MNLSCVYEQEHDIVLLSPFVSLSIMNCFQLPFDFLVQVERERGITVKAQTATMFHKNTFSCPSVRDTEESPIFLLNLVDTPGHVDFSYEVSRSLAACQGALLVVDAAQGVQAQTVANFYLAFESNLTIIPIINKIDQPTADPDRVKAQLKSMFDLDPKDTLLTSAKTGQGLEYVLPAVIERIPCPPGKIDSSLRMLLLDSYYDEYKGVICHVAVVDGALRKGDKIASAATSQVYEVLDVGIMHPELTSTGVLFTGQVGYVVSGMRSTKEARVGDTLYQAKSVVEPLPGVCNPFSALLPIFFSSSLLSSFLLLLLVNSHLLFLIGINDLFLIII